MHEFPKIHEYQHGYPWFLDVSLQFRISVDIDIDIQAGISMQGYSAMDIRKNKYPWMNILVFMNISLWLSIFMDIHLDIVGFL